MWGVFNLGFLAVKMAGQGRQFIDWWTERLKHHCYDEIENGLFTDQRWVDLAPAFFDDIGIVREPQYNVATWNLTHRRATGRAAYEIDINGKPLVFYHFSGFDSGAQRAMLERYGHHSPVLFELRDWYVARCEELGHSTLSHTDCVYNTFSNGERITSSQRLSTGAVMTWFGDFPIHSTRAGRGARTFTGTGSTAGGAGATPHETDSRSCAGPARRLARSARSVWRRFSVPA